ncbi:MAG: hypothetical protein JWN72_2160 [Thermoleophilia bacterium]|nr:hypothetical protein [Thermoleophilia bacterium]
MDRIIDNGPADLSTAPVTTRSRITGARPGVQPAPVTSFPVDTDHRSVDWGAVMASVITGVAVTTTLVILGVSTGLIAGDANTSANDAQGILGAIGAWTVIAALIGTFVGSMLGGRLARWLDRGTLVYHALTSWAVATILSIALAALVAIGFGAATTSVAASDVAANDTTAQAADTAAPASNEPDASGGDSAAADTNGTASSSEKAAENAADALGGAGVALTIGMLLTLVASAAGWWIGSRKKLTDFEREDTVDGSLTA